MACAWLHDISNGVNLLHFAGGLHQLVIAAEWKLFSLPKCLLGETNCNATTGRELQVSVVRCGKNGDAQIKLKM